jgi:uncharacterized membrane protein YecN with MAPEG domain
MVEITAFYAGLLGLMSIGIMLVIGRIRGATGISVGDGGNLELIAAMRRHANFVEFVPLCLILIAFLELNGVGSTAIHALAGGLFFARLCHAIGFRTDDSLKALRPIGAIGSTLVLAVSSIWAMTLLF